MATAGGATFREKMLVTHRGLSGPAILQASSYWRPGEVLMIGFCAGACRWRGAIGSFARARSAAGFGGTAAGIARGAAAEAGGQLSGRGSAHRRAGRTRHWRRASSGCADGSCIRPEPRAFEKAEVTAGGVDTSDLQARTMEARAVPGLFFIGEAVDVTGQLGGFNFQWAWASAVAAGRAV